MTDTSRGFGFTREQVAHSNRFRRVANRYPLRVTEAYGGDVARAATDSDEVVAATVAAWEAAHGVEPRDWHTFGREQEGRPESDDGVEVRDGYAVDWHAVERELESRER